MILGMSTTTNMRRLYVETERDGLQVRLSRVEGSSAEDAVFVLAVFAPDRDASLMEVKTKLIESAAVCILDRYDMIRPDEPLAAS